MLLYALYNTGNEIYYRCIVAQHCINGDRTEQIAKNISVDYAPETNPFMQIHLWGPSRQMDEI